MIVQEQSTEEQIKTENRKVSYLGNYYTRHIFEGIILFWDSK